MRYTESVERVRYFETDQMGIAHHANYLAWFEIGRTDLCREAGISYKTIEERGYLLVVSEINCRYRQPFKYDDVVRIRTHVDRVASRAMRFVYELRSDDGATLHADGFSSHLWLDRATRRPVVAPADILKMFEPFVV